MGDLDNDDDEQRRWDEACRREEAVRNLLNRNPDGMKRRDVTDLAWELGLSRATTYRMIRLFRAGGTVTSLMDRTRGRRDGFRTLDKDREEIIRQTIASSLSKPTRPPFSKLCRQVQVSCAKAGLETPNWRTIKLVSKTSIYRPEGNSAAKQRSSKRQHQHLAATARLAPWRSFRSITRRSMRSSSMKKAANPLADPG